MSSIETWLGAQPHILSVQGRAPRLLPCVSVRERKTEKGRKRDRESEVERLKSKRTGIGGDQWRCWTVERICVTAISKTITPAAPTVELLASSSALSSDLTLSQRNPPSAAEADLSRRRAQTAGSQPRRPAAAPRLENILDFHRRRSAPAQFVAPNGLLWELSRLSSDLGKRGFYKMERTGLWKRTVCHNF